MAPSETSISDRGVPMDYETIRLREESGMATILLNRADVLNALDTQMRAELLDVIRSASKTARAVALTGAGRAFCSGQDLGQGRNLATADMERTLRDEYVPLLRAIADCPVPVIAAVNGPAVGAGASLALACDVVIAAESAVFRLAFSRIGLIPDAGATWLLPRQAGFARAMGAALFAEAITARQAAEWGMIWEAVPDEAFNAHWRRRAAHIASGPTVAFAAAKEAIRKGLENGLEDQLLLEARLQGRCGGTRDFREGVLAFLQKREAKFEGR